jgi:cytochrome P450
VQKYGQPTLVARFLRNALGRGLLTSEGSDHRHQRRVISPAFGDSHVRALTPTFRSLAQILARKWEEATAAGEVELDVHDWMTRFTCASPCPLPRSCAQFPQSTLSAWPDLATI